MVKKASFNEGDRVSFLCYEVALRDDGVRIVYDKRKRMTGEVVRAFLPTGSNVTLYDIRLDPNQTLNSHSLSVVEKRDKMCKSQPI